MHARRTQAFSLFGALIVGACGSTSPSPSVGPVATASESSSTAGTAPSAPAASTATFQPTFEADACPADVTDEIPYVTTCGYLHVLEDRAKPGSHLIRLFVIRIEPPGGTVTPDPILVLTNLGERIGYAGVSATGQRTHRVTYVLDTRGIGHSEPSLDCPEVLAAGPALVGLRLGDTDHRAALAGTAQTCADRLSTQGIDLSAYDIAANAADIEDLRVTLGIKQWNLQAVGTASPILFEVARRYPETVRTLIIDSPALPGANLITVGPAATDLAIARLSAACEADAACSKRAPELGLTI